MLIDRKLIQLARTALRPFILTLLSGATLSGMIILQAGTLSRILSLAFIEKRGLYELRGMLAFLFGVIVIRSLLVWGNIVFASHFARDVKVKLRESLFAHLLSGGITWRRQVDTGELSSIFLQGVDALDAYFSQYLPQVIFAGITPALILLVVFPLDALSALIFCVTAPLIPVLMILIGSTSEAATKRQWLGLSRMSAYFLDSIQGLETLKLFDRDRNRILRVAEISDQYREKTMSVLRITFLSALVLEFISTISTAVIAVQIGLRLLLGYIGFEQAFFILLLAPEFYLPLRMLGVRFHASMTGIQAANRIFSLLQKVDEAQRHSGDYARYLSIPERPLKAVEIDVSNVGFQYPGSGLQNLTDISFHLPPKTMTALVGPSGSGKTTLSYLLLGLLTPASGTIRVDQIPLETVSGWWQQVGWVSQKPVLFRGSIRENLSINGRMPSDSDLWEAVEMAGLKALIENLPDELDTMIGEAGTNLSSGQAQRLTLARIFLQDPAVVIMDEPTAHLDLELEDVLSSVFASWLKEKTSLVIAHRLRTVQAADQILVLDHGRIVDRGRHVELLECDGLYQRMVRREVVQ